MSPSDGILLVRAILELRDGMTDRVRGRLEAGNPRVTKLAAAHLVGLIEPEDIANMAVFLASEVIEHVYPVDSGVTIS